MNRLKAVFGVSIVCIGLACFPYALLIFPVAYLIGFMINYNRFLKG